jgi:hypothetical protein
MTTNIENTQSRTLNGTAVSWAENPPRSTTRRTQDQLLIDAPEEARNWMKAYYAPGSEWTLTPSMADVDGDAEDFGSAPLSIDEENYQPEPSSPVTEELYKRADELSSIFHDTLWELKDPYDVGVRSGDLCPTMESEVAEENATRRIKKLTLELYAELDVAPTLDEALSLTSQNLAGYRVLRDRLRKVKKRQERYRLQRENMAAGSMMTGGTRG